MSHVLVLTFVFFVAFVFAEIAKHLRLSPTIGQLFAGIVLGFPALKALIFTEVDMGFLKVLSDLGVIFLMLLTGFEISYQRLLNTEKDSLMIGLGSVFFPFILGFLFMHFAFGYGFLSSIVVGTALSLSAETTTVNVLMELKQLSSRVGSVIVGSGLFDDIGGIVLLTFLTFWIHGGVFDIQGLLSLFLKISLFVILIVVAVKYIPIFVKRVEKEHSDVSTFKSTILIGLGLALISEIAGLSAVVGALIAGLLLKKTFSCCNRDRVSQTHDLEALTLGFIVPFFFVYIGLQIDYIAMWEHLWLVVFIIILATFGKIVGVMAMRSFTDLSWRQTYIIGWALNSRGVVELVIAEIARASGLISPEIYSAIIVMAVVTTLIFPFVLEYEVGRNKVIMR